VVLCVHEVASRLAGVRDAVNVSNDPSIYPMAPPLLLRDPHVAAGSGRLHEEWERAQHEAQTGVMVHPVTVYPRLQW
jgi:hypothetical protein